MSKSKGAQSARARYAALDAALRAGVPHLLAVWDAEDDFLGFNIKVNLDGTVLAVLKRAGSDGTDMVCFGVGYGVIGAFLAIDATVNAGAWRVDKPWKPTG